MQCLQESWTESLCYFNILGEAARRRSAKVPNLWKPGLRRASWEALPRRKSIAVDAP